MFTVVIAVPTLIFACMATSRSRLGAGAKIALLVVPLVVILAASLWYAASAWFSLEGPPMPATGYVAMALGVVLSLLVGVVLMALLFYSSRHGYDEAHRPENE